METLLCSPATSSDIVLGKFLMVLTGSLSAVFFSLVSLGGTMAIIGAAAGQIGGRSAIASGLPTIDPLGLLGVLAMILPVAVLFSALTFSLALFAKSQKEAQSYLTPLAFAVILPCAIAVLPGIDLTFPSLPCPDCQYLLGLQGDAIGSVALGVHCRDLRLDGPLRCGRACGRRPDVRPRSRPLQDVSCKSLPKGGGDFVNGV